MVKGICQRSNEDTKQAKQLAIRRRLAPHRFYKYNSVLFIQAQTQPKTLSFVD